MHYLLLFIIVIMSLITVSKSFGMKTFGLSTSLLSSTTTSLSSASSSSPSSLNKLRMMSSQGMKVLDLDVQKFGKILTENRAAFQVIDVREPHELDVAKLPYSDVLNLPLSTASEWGGKVETGILLDPTKPTICLCHHGMRSMRVAQFLVSKCGFNEVHNVNGGIHQYATKVDPTIGTY